ncbi:MAG: phosphatidylinositol mannoside acyltransferase [Actinomycetota bacterium]|nr:phosphatidylinositol mannoside acyltransferase [Actinomycetota bacterium]MDK1027023.1 phosphatidylinositol mannoside acyltransferase [Actinomycetota bacterium]MDK1103025.1 phosphatidylinositol mannoside acyltransferase [Actinomycetota bacterium]
MKDWVAYIPFRIAALLFGMLPEPAIRKLGVWAGRVASGRNKANRSLLASHMRRVVGPGASDPVIFEAVDGMYRSYGRYWAETLWFRPRRRRSIMRSVERVNFDPVYAARDAGRGIVFALPHIGNWEVAGLIAEDIGLNLMAVAEDLPNRKITDWFLDVRAKFGIDIVLTSDPNRRSKMIRHLEGGGALALLADRDVTGRGISVDFFGEETTLPAGPAALAELTGSVLLPVVVYFKEGGGHILEVGDPIIIPEAETRAERVNIGTRQVAETLERMIRRQPSQWHLFQPNWPSDRENDAKEHNNRNRA